MGAGQQIYEYLDSTIGIDKAMKLARPDVINAKTKKEKKKAMEKPITAEDLYRMSAMLGGAYCW